MSRTHSLVFTALLCVVSACAANGSHAPVRATYSRTIPTGPVQVRNVDGDVLPDYAIADAGEYVEIECRNGQVYQIVNMSKDLYTPSAQRSVGVRMDLDGICDRVRNSRLDYDHVH